MSAVYRHPRAGEGGVRSPERRARTRWALGDGGLAATLTLGGWGQRHRVGARILDLSPDGVGIRVAGVPAALPVETPATLDAEVPGEGRLRLRGRVRWSGPSGGEPGWTKIGVQLADRTDRRLRSQMAHVALSLGGAPPRQLGEAGLPPSSVLRAVAFGLARSPEEYRSVLALRKHAYAGAGKVPAHAPDEAMGDELDRRARILVAWHHGHAVASLRIMVHGEHDRWEHEEYFPWSDLLPPKRETVEITRVCTHADFRRSDLLLGLLQHCGAEVARMGRRWLLGSATPKLVPLYGRVGCRPVPILYRHLALGGEEHQVFVGDVPGTLAGRTLSALEWTVVWGEVYRRLRSEAVLPSPGLVTSLRLGTLLALRPLALGLARLMARRGR